MKNKMTKYNSVGLYNPDNYQDSVHSPDESGQVVIKKTFNHGRIEE
jgi:hypothetical protein